jgi:hypothetical protein
METIATVHYLQLAAERGHDDVIRIMLDAGVPVDFRDADQFKRTPLINAVYFGRESTARLLLERGADLNAMYCYHRIDGAIEEGVSSANEKIRILPAALERHVRIDMSVLDCARRHSGTLRKEFVAELVASGAKRACELGGVSEDEGPGSFESGLAEIAELLREIGRAQMQGQAASIRKGAI